MDTVSLEGKEYVKAASVAKKFGYTRDYIGQLCRAEKIDAQLVGRSWYVFLPSLEEHKKNRYQSVKSQKKTSQSHTETAGETVAVRVTSDDAHAHTTAGIAGRVSEAFAEKVLKPDVSDEPVGKKAPQARRANVKHYLEKYRAAHYSTDMSTLLPNLKERPEQNTDGTKTEKATHLTVETDEPPEPTVELEITESTDSADNYYLEPEAHKQPLQGELTVDEYSVMEAVAATVEPAEEPTPASNINDSVAAAEELDPEVATVSVETSPPEAEVSIKPIHRTAEASVGEVAVEPEQALAADAALEQERSAAHALAPSTQVQKKPMVQTRSLPATRSNISLMPIAVSVVAGVLVCSLALGLSWRIDFSNSIADPGYQFNVSNVIGSQK